MTGRAPSLWPVAGVPDRAQPGQQSLTIGSVVEGQTFGTGRLPEDLAGCFHALCKQTQGDVRAAASKRGRFVRNAPRNRTIQ